MISDNCKKEKKAWKFITMKVPIDRLIKINRFGLKVVEFG